MKMQNQPFSATLPPRGRSLHGRTVKKPDCSSFCYSLLKTVCYPRTDHHSPPVVLPCSVRQWPAPVGLFTTGRAVLALITLSAITCQPCRVSPFWPVHWFTCMLPATLRSSPCGALPALRPVCQTLSRITTSSPVRHLLGCTEGDRHTRHRHLCPFAGGL